MASRSMRQSGARTKKTIRARASFDLNCPAESLKLRVLDLFSDKSAKQVGVIGCDRRVTYVNPMGTGWVANLASE